MGGYDEYKKTIADVMKMALLEQQLK